jgi:nucleotide-binding universal stress UspA family protein
MKTIVVGYDDTEPAKRALERAGQLAKAFDSKLVVVSVAPVLTNIGHTAGPIDPADSPQDHVEELKHAQAYLEGEAVQAEYLPGIGHPAETLAQFANDHDADLIVVGHHHTGVSRLLGQSVSDSVTHRVHCDVLLVR